MITNGQATNFKEYPSSRHNKQIRLIIHIKNKNEICEEGSHSEIEPKNNLIFDYFILNIFTFFFLADNLYVKI